MRWKEVPKLKFDKKDLLLYAVTDRSWLGEQSLPEQVEAAISGGITCLQLREKELPQEEFLAEALLIRDLCRVHHIPFIINDDVEVAIRSQADGIHIGQHDQAAAEVRQAIGLDMILGVSAQTVEQALAAEAAGADYLGVGAVFSTDTKKDADDVSYEILQAICQAVSIPVVAIGGINKANLPSLAGSGIVGVALVSAIFAAADIEAECRELLSLCEGMVQA